MKLIVKYFFIADVLFLGGHLRLESSCIWINKVPVCVFDTYIHTNISH